MSGGIPVLYVINSGKLELTGEGKMVESHQDSKYLESLLHQYSDQVTTAYKERTIRTTRQEEYEDRDHQIRADLGAGKISFNTAKTLLNNLGPNPESPLYLEKHNPGVGYLFLFQVDNLIRVLSASRDLVNQRMRELASPR